MEETAGGGSWGCKYFTLDPADCQGPHPISWGPRTHSSPGVQPERAPGFPIRYGLLQFHQLPPVLFRSLHEYVKVTDDRLSVKTENWYDKLFVCLFCIVCAYHLPTVLILNCAITHVAAEELLLTASKDMTCRDHYTHSLMMNHLYVSVYQSLQESIFSCHSRLWW